MNKLITVLIELLEGTFCIGLLGSAVVILMTSVEDLRVMLEKEEVPADSNEPTVQQ